MPLFSYKMTHDTGFAPNPYFGFMTLATCKPGIRRTKQVGDYIAGFASLDLCKHLPGEEKLVYIMKVTEKISISGYWNDPRFRCKRPPIEKEKSTADHSKELLTTEEYKKRRGDNIYKPSSNSKVGFSQLPNTNHCDADIETDINGEYVLVSDDFYYFGIAAIDVSPFNIELPKGQNPHGKKTDEYDELLSYLNERYYQKKNTLIGHPHGKQILIH